MSFLPVGHTHIDVDQMFSQISVATEKMGCLTPQDLLRIIRQSYTQSQGETTQEGAKPQYATISNVYAVREWLLPYMNKLHGLNSFHNFVIVRNDEGKAVLHFKAWCNSQWEAEAYEPIVLLKDNLPQGVPDTIKPDYEAVDLARLRSMVERCVTNGVFTSQEEQEWLTFLEEEKTTASAYEDIEEKVYNKNDGELFLKRGFCENLKSGFHKIDTLVVIARIAEKRSQQSQIGWFRLFTCIFNSRWPGTSKQQEANRLQ